MHVPSWKNVLRVSGVVSFAHNRKNVLCRKVYVVLLIRKMFCVVRCVFSQERGQDHIIRTFLSGAILLKLEWQDHIIRIFLSGNIFRSMIFHKLFRCLENVVCREMCIVAKMGSTSEARMARSLHILI